MFQIEGITEFIEGIDAWLVETEELADGAFRGLILSAFKFVLNGTPEWTGNLVANWKLTVGVPAEGYDHTVFKDAETGSDFPEPFNRHWQNEAAIAYAKANAAPAIPFIHTDVTVFITNNAPYAGMVEVDKDEKGKSFIRPVNQPIEMVHAAAERFSIVGEISDAQAFTLAAETL